MKKIIFLIITCVLLCGCQEKDKYKEYTHYDLKDRKTYTYAFNNDNGNKDIYKIAKINMNPNAQKIDYGLFYKVGEDDYILLDDIDIWFPDFEDYFENSKSFVIPKTTYFYQDVKNNENKLYINCNTNYVKTVYILNAEKYKKESLNFDTSKIDSYFNFEPSHYVVFDDIIKVENGFIYYNAREKDYSNSFRIKCSLETYICELIE